MILFKKEHVEPIRLRKKWQTRRNWKKPRAKVGSIHQARTMMLDKDSTFANLRITRVWKERLFDISRADAWAEGGYTYEEYIRIFCLINKMTTGEAQQLVVTAIEFEMVEE